ncbi:hypothetical protein CCAND95_90028 [Capnocytophaga canis]|nr:hypothetical protein CCAND95_90028 [Capnocytophaga canis]
MRKIPAPTTKSPTIIMTTEFENPASASSGESILKNIKHSKAQTATKSERTFPCIKKKEAKAKMNNVRYIGENKLSISKIHFRKHFFLRSRQQIYNFISKKHLKKNEFCNRKMDMV